MNNILNWAKIAISAVGGIASYLWGPWDALLTALVCLVTIDYITGLIKAFVLKKLDSNIGFRGLLKKVIIFLVVALATIIGGVIPESNQAIRSAVILYYVANESLSIIENAGEMGLPVPDILKNAIKRLQSDKTEQDDDAEA